MIYYLVTRQHAYTMAEYLGSWGAPVAPKVRVVPYGALPANRDLPSGTYVFSDLERLGPTQLRVVTALADRLAAAGLPVLNHPAKSLRRLELLRALHREGVNRFRAFPATEIGGDLRYPAFIREEAEHTGSLSRLVHDRADLDRCLLLLAMEGFEPRGLLVVELCETADATGLYRKYSAFRIGDRVFPRSMLFSKSWVQKDLDLLEPSHIEENRAYWRENPHERALSRIFDRASIDYGRIDYGLLDGAIQVWEINTNPIIARPRDQYPPAQHAYHQMFADVFNDALARIDADVDPGQRIAVDWSRGPA